MKRCPQCEFVYEDEQQLCDMDRAELVFDLSFLAENVSAPIAARLNQSAFHLTRLSAIGLAAAVLSGALSFVYFSTLTRGNERAAKQLESAIPVKSPELLTTDTAPAFAPPASPGEISAANPANNLRGIEPFNNSRKTTRAINLGQRNRGAGSEQSAPSNIVGPVTRVTTARMTDNGAVITTSSDGSRQTTLRGRPSVSAQAKPALVAQRKESRVGSFLKTTGQIIKKPFKF